jgi:hypothetical protein
LCVDVLILTVTWSYTTDIDCFKYSPLLLVRPRVISDRFVEAYHTASPGSPVSHAVTRVSRPPAFIRSAFGVFFSLSYFLLHFLWRVFMEKHSFCQVVVQYIRRPSLADTAVLEKVVRDRSGWGLNRFYLLWLFSYSLDLFTSLPPFSSTLMILIVWVGFYIWLCIRL